MGEMSSRISVIVPTFHRDDDLRNTLHLLASQTVQPREAVVVDNAASASCEALCQDMSGRLPFALTYLAAGSNGGPAGATRIGMEELLTRVSDDDWIARADDDSPPNIGNDHFASLLESAAQADVRIGGVGAHGARFDFQRAELFKPPNDEGLTPVDYLPTNFMPLFAVGAVREVGPFREDLFFGLDEVEYGLRLRRHGYELLRVDSAARRRPPTVKRRDLGAPSWRRYYSLRNRIVIAREYCNERTALRVAATLILKALHNVPRSPRLAVAHLQLTIRAIRDAYCGNLGRSVEPRVVNGALDYRAGQ